MSLKTQIHHILFHRHLLWEFLRRDIQARYIGSAMGLFWSVIHPLVLLTVYTFVFEIILGVKYKAMGRETIGGFYIFCGLLPWYAFQEALIRSTTSIVDNAHLIKQVHFPAKILPAYITLSAIVNQLIATVIFLIAILIYSGQIPWTICFFPLVLVFQIILFFGLGLLFSTLNTYFRDIGPLVNIGSMLLMWSTPMLYTLDNVKAAPEYIQNLVFFNPLTSLVLIYHDMILYGNVPPLSSWAILIAVSFGTLLVGYPVFTRHHGEFADLL
jgi:ABC-type polysaccharide/polyol phosphate export permease